MKKLLLGLLGLLVVVGGGGAAFLLTMTPKQRPAPVVKVEATPERLARGEYLSKHVWLCFDCHSKLDDTQYGTPVKPGTFGAGGECFTRENAGFPGKVCAQNITSDQETGLGGWTDGEIMRAIREGVNRKGEALFPMMPYQLARNMSDEDLASVVAYLRTVPPIKNKPEVGKVDFPVSVFIKLAPQPLEGPVPEPDRKDTVAYGKYLSYACLECHTNVDDHGERLPGRDFAGGRAFRFGELKVRSSNLTFHPTGLNDRTKEQFVAMFSGWRTVTELPKVAPKDNTMMPWAQLRGLTDEDLGAIYDYLKSVPKVDNAVERRVVPELPQAAEPVPAAAAPAQPDAAAPVAPGNP